MAIDPLPIWISEFEALGTSGGPDWAPKFAGYIADRVTGIQGSPLALGGAGMTFVFQRAVLQAELLKMMPTVDPLSGIKGMADAWGKAVQASVATVLSGATAGPIPTPYTLFSVVFTTVIDPPSILAGKAIIMTLLTAPPVGVAAQSQFPIKLRQAFLSLTVTAAGLDTSPSPDPPKPLTAAAVPLI